jgi:hypothetical protein
MVAVVRTAPLTQQTNSDSGNCYGISAMLTGPPTSSVIPSFVISQFNQFIDTEGPS